MKWLKKAQACTWAMYLMMALQTEEVKDIA
jgi:hypothetical protein